MLLHAQTDSHVRGVFIVHLQTYQFQSYIINLTVSIFYFLNVLKRSERAPKIQSCKGFWDGGSSGTA